MSSKKRNLILGCIADDVTGATDLAINLVQGGMRVVQLLAIPTKLELSELDADAVVVGLKTRSIPKREAKEQSVQCLRVFRQSGIERYFFKYCSTFDSTSEGNIGPVAAALMETIDMEQTVFCPALPRNGRTVYQGHLFVNGKLLNESGMENHPLNPMTDANLVRVLSQQCDRNVGLLSFEDIEAGIVADRLEELRSEGTPFVIVDACSDEQLVVIAGSAADLPLVTGGSGIARFLPAAYRKNGLLTSAEYVVARPRVTGRSLIVAGSCSLATNRQVEWMKDKIPCWPVDVDEVVTNKEIALAKVQDWARSADVNSPLLIATTATAERVAEIQSQHGGKAVAAAIEDFLSEVTSSFVSDFALARLIIAGGETSGAILQSLGVRALRIDAEICAGVPWTESIGERPMALALKSGNFGSDDFFERALEMLP